MKTCNQATPATVNLIATLSRSAHPEFFLASAALLACLSSVPTLSHSAKPDEPANDSWAKGRILVIPRAGLPEKELEKILKTHGGKGRKLGQSDLYVVDLPNNGSEKSTVEKLARHPHIKHVEVDQRVSPDFVPNDPYYGSEWHLGKIGASSAWDISQGSGITIAILDSGVDSTHPDLAAQIVPGWNFYDNNANTSDVNGHGTAVAGAAAASSNNSTGVVAVAGQSKIMPVRIADANAYAYWSTVAQGLIYAADHGARVANISYGVAGSATVQSAAQYMKSKGGLVIVSAGNNGVDENITPTTTMIPVSATDSNDLRTSWSSYGNFVMVTAPGSGIWTTVLNGAYGVKSGTSFSSPITAGVVALMMSAKPDLDGSQIESFLYSTATDLGAAGRDPYYGYGRVNVAAAVNAAATAQPPVDTQAPAVSISAPLGSSTVGGLIAINVTASDNVGVSRVELRVNGSTVAIDSSAPYGFSWDSTGVANGMSTLVAYAFDAAENSRASAPVSVNVANGLPAALPDTIAPAVTIINPVAGNVSGNVSVTVNASDNSGAAGISLSVYIDGVLKATGKGATLGFSWNTRKIAVGPHTIQAIAKDAAGNASSTVVQVMR